MRTSAGFFTLCGLGALLTREWLAMAAAFALSLAVPYAWDYLSPTRRAAREADDRELAAGRQEWQTSYMLDTGPADSGDLSGATARHLLYDGMPDGWTPLEFGPPVEDFVTREAYTTGLRDVLEEAA